MDQQKVDNNTNTQDGEDEHALIVQRRQKLSELREAMPVAFPNDFRPEHLAANLHQEYDNLDDDALVAKAVQVSLAGRLMSRRIMGKASFANLQDRSGRIQLFLQKDNLTEDVYNLFRHKLDLGDIVAVTGQLFRTKTGELSVRCNSLRLLTKSLRPLPEKFHGLTDMETRYRQRYVDLIMNPESRDTFRKRSAIIAFIRSYLLGQDFLEVETPMMHAIPGGATAQPFLTHHNALDMTLYLRVAPELFLKRLVVGGFDRVFELNRNFRNEGLSTRHNPEFTSVEFYQAYADYHQLMDLTEDMFRKLAENVLGSTAFHSQGVDYDFARPFQRLTVRDAILQHNPELSLADLNDVEKTKQLVKKHGVQVMPTWGLGRLLMELFDATVEQKLLQPTFITAYPTEVSPLARRNDEDPFVTDRFELFIGGRELANGFSELNDAEDQAERFRAQVREKEAGDDEAMYYDDDFIRALEYGLPPTAGEGIGVDRLVMLLTDSPSIRDVLFFPLMRPLASSEAN